MIRQYCAKPRCPTLVRKGYCDEHRPKRRQNPNKRRFYNSARWRGKGGIRIQQLRRAPLCEVNAKCHDPTPAEAVHHKDDDTENNDPMNLQSACTACHTWLENQPEGALSRN